jgi:S-formylglutathione hydrolase FrmB
LSLSIVASAVRSAFTAIALKLVTVKCDSLFISPPKHQNQFQFFIFSGLTCTEETFMVKAGAQRFAAEYGLMLAPDTSPRNTGIDGEDDDWDFGSGVVLCGCHG